MTSPTGSYLLTINYPYDSLAFDRRIIKFFKSEFGATECHEGLQVLEPDALRTLCFVFNNYPPRKLMDALELQTEELEDFSYTLVGLVVPKKKK